MNLQVKIESTLCEQLIRKRAVAKSMFTRTESFLQTGNTDSDEIQVRLNKLPSILVKYEASQEELEACDDVDHTEDRATFEQQYYEVEVKFNKLLRLSTPQLLSCLLDNVSEHGGSIVGSTHSSNTHIKLPTIALPSFSGDHCLWLDFRDTFDSLIVQNSVLTDVQRLHYLLAALKGEAKD